ncbi:MAG: LacI family DNA-binding transcriptional regulator [Bacteroidota bacterium]
MLRALPIRRTNPVCPMGATIRDVARRAGVSISTVSRVLNDTCPVHPDKRRLVLDAADALGYAPNPAARSLLNKKTGGLGVLLPFVSGEFFSEFLSALDKAAQQNDLFLVISTSHRRLSEFTGAMQALDKRVDGLIVMAPELLPSDITSIVRTEDPVVFVNTRAEGLPFDTVNFDNHQGARALTQHLLDLGHKRIAFVRGPSDAHDAMERLRGYRDAMLEAGLGLDPTLEVHGEYTLEAGYAATRTLLARNVQPTAIIAANDYAAIGVLRALHEAHLRVPEDVSVGGFDGLNSGLYTLPPLTTVRAPIRKIGQIAITLLLERLRYPERERATQRRVLPVELVARASTAPPARPGVRIRATGRSR